MNLILLGPPGAGKGTQAKLLAERLGLHHLCLGDILRNAVANRTELGILVENIMQRGELVKDNIVKQLIDNALEELSLEQNFVLDGYPRNVKQAEDLSAILRLHNHVISKVVALEVDFDVLVDRVQKRAEQDRAFGKPVRLDDTPNVLKNRLLAYQEQTFPLLDYYEKQSILLKIDAMQTIEEVYSTIVKGL